MGRNEADNSALERLVRPGDAILRVRDFPSPFALARQLTPWDNETLQDAASLVASYSPKGVRAAEASPDGTIAVRVQINGESTFLNVTPKRTPALPWGEPEFVDVRKAIKAENRPTFDE